LTTALRAPGQPLRVPLTARNPLPAPSPKKPPHGQDGKAFFRNRYVRTAAFQREQLLRRRVARGRHDLGTLANGWLLAPPSTDFKQPANRQLVSWAGRLFALSESGVPYQLNKLDMSTVGECDVRSAHLGVPDAASATAAAAAAAAAGGGSGAAAVCGGGAHAVADAAGAERLVLFSSDQSGPDALITIREYDASGRLVLQRRHRLQARVARARAVLPWGCGGG